MTAFETSGGRRIMPVPGYRNAHHHATAADVFPPEEGFHGLNAFGFDGFMKDHYTYSLMIDFLESLGVDCRWNRALDIGGAEGTVSRLLKGEGRARWTATIELNKFDGGVTTGVFLREFFRFRAAAALSRFSPTLRRFLIGDGAWRGKRLSPLFSAYGYMPPRGSTFWKPRLRAMPTVDEYIVGDVFDLEQQFDLITGFSVISYMDVEPLFHKIAALLVEGGVCFLISDYWWFAVNSSLVIGEFPYAMQRLSPEDFERYVAQYHASEFDDWMARYRYYHQGKARPTLNDYVAMADAAGLEFLGSKFLMPPHLRDNRATVSPRMLNRHTDTRIAPVLEDVRQWRPDVGMTDLLSKYVVMAFTKPPARRETLAARLAK